jgi:Protein of unknown function (DUF3352)
MISSRCAASSRPPWRLSFHSRLCLPLALAALLLPAMRLDAQEPVNPLQLVPAQADWVVKIDQPSRVVESLYQHEVVKDWLKLEGVRDFFDTTNFRRLIQLKDFFEKKLGVSGLDMLDRLAGNGVVFAARVHEPGAPALILVVQSKDEELLRQFVRLTVSVIEQELARQEKKEKLIGRKFGKFDGYQFGPGCAALAGLNLLVASDPAVLQAALDLLDKNGAGSIAEQPRFQASQKLLPKQPLAWSWVDLDAMRKIKTFKAGLDAVAMDPNFLFAVGGLLDMLQRSPMVVISLSQEGPNLVLENRMPIGREGMDAKAVLYLPHDDKGALPLLQPPRTLGSISYFLDLKAFWDNRAKLLNKTHLKPLEDFDAQSGRFLGGTKLSKLLQQSGPHQRIVVAQPLKSPYKLKPETPIPAFALVQEMRDPAFAKSMDTILRAAGLLASFQFNLHMVDEKHGGHKVVAYYFQENKPLDGDTTYLRLNYSPAFAIVDNQLIVSSTAELAHDLIDEVLKEASAAKASPATTQIAVFAKGGAAALQAAREQLLAQAILNQALPPAVARKQIESFIGFVERLGSLRFEVQYGQNDFRYAIRWEYK